MRVNKSVGGAARFPIRTKPDNKMDLRLFRRQSENSWTLKLTTPWTTDGAKHISDVDPRDKYSITPNRLVEEET